MAAARGTPGASLVTLVTASLRDARPGGGRGEEERGGEARGRADTCISERYASGPTSAGATTPSPAARAPARGAREVSASSSARGSAATREGGPARAGEPLARAGGGRAPPPAPAPTVVHSYFATLLGATTDPGDALEMLRDAPACLRRNRLVEMKKAAKAEATRKRLHSLLEAGERLDAATFPGLASAFFPTHVPDSASSDDADERRRELRRLFPGGALYVDERPRTYPMSNDDDNLAPSLSSPDTTPPTGPLSGPGEEKGDETDAVAGESPGGGVAGETSTAASGKKRTTPAARLVSKRRERPNESATAAAARYRQAAAAPTSPPRTLPFLAGGIQVIRIGRVVPALSGRNSAQSSYVLPAGFTTRRRYTSATDPTKKVWYESTVEVRSCSDSQQPATNDCKKGTGKKDAGKEKEGFVVIVHEVGNPALTWRGTSPTHAWQQVIAAVNVRAKTRKKAAVSGPQFLGLSLPEVAEEIAKLPGYAECIESMAARGGTNGGGGGGGGERSPTNARRTL